MMDRNNNGALENGKELFGDFTPLPNGMLAASGFDALAYYDFNHDGKIDANDPVWEHLKIWQYGEFEVGGEAYDPDISGIITTLDDLGIGAIYLDSEITNQPDDAGNTEIRSGYFEWVDGSLGTVAEYSFQRDTGDTIPVEYQEVSPEIAALANLYGYGNVTDLDQAMMAYASGGLKALNEAFSAEETIAGREAILTQLMFKWAGVESVAPDSRGPFMDGRKVALLEKFYAETRANPDPGQAIVWGETYRQLSEIFYGSLMAQTHLKDLHDTITYTWNDEKQDYDIDTTALIAALQDSLAADPEKGKEFLSEFARSRRGMGYFAENCFLSVREAFIQMDPSLGWVFDSGRLPVYDAPHQGARWWVTTEIEGTDGSEAVKGSLTLGGGSLNGLNGNDVIYGTDRNESLTNEIGNAILVAGGGDDRIWAGAGADILDGGAGNDLLYGQTGNDTYMFRRGSGQDTIIDTDATPDNIDTIWLGSNLTPEEITVRRSGNNLVLTITGTDDVLTVKDFFRNDGILNRVERIQFMDGTVWTDSDMIARAYAPSEDDDIIYGGSESDDLRGLGGRDRIYGMDGDDVLRGDEASDWLYGGAGNDTLDGGADDDIVDGGAGDDTYVFGRGSGHDRIIFSTAAPGDTDTISLGDDVLPTDILLQRTGGHVAFLDDVLLTVADTGDSIELLKWIRNDTPVSGLHLTFADGTVWDTDWILDVLVTGTQGDDTIYGFSRADVMIGGDGNDTMYAHAGDDTLEAGSGDDQLFGEAGNDTLRGGAGKDTLIGDLGDDVFDGGADADTLYGEKGVYVYHSYYSPGTGNGNDTYLFGRGYGQDAIIDHDKTPGNMDTIRFLDDLTPDDIIVRRSKSDLELTINGTTDKLTVYNWFWCDSDEYKVERMEFSDGTVWDVDTMRQMTLRGSEGDDTLIGYSDSDIINGYGGDDTLYGRDGVDLLDGGTGDDFLFGESNDDTLLGGDGNDTLAGGAGDDVLDGGIGNDTLYGGNRNDRYDSRVSNGNDMYLFGRGSGQDTVMDYDAAPGNLDTILVDGDLHPEDINLKRNGDNLVLSINGTVDTLTVSNWFKDEAGAWQVERIQFSDGTTWDVDRIKEMVLQGTDADDVLIGYSTSDTIHGFSGNDRIFARDGDDTIHGGTGHDTLFGEAGNDTLLGGEGDDDLWAGAGDDILDGGVGTDYLNGGIGDDTYLFGRNSGRDTIVDTDTTAGNVDRVLLGPDVGQSDVVLKRGGNDLFLSIEGTTDRLQLSNWFLEDGGSIELVQFSDGTTWDRTYMREVVGIAGIDDDYLIGTPEDDVMDGGDGNDTIYGRAGADMLHGGSGQDLIYGEDGNDTIHGGAGNDELHAGRGNDTIFGEDGDDTLFADEGSNSLDGGAGNDLLQGSSGNDALLGGSGSDYLSGGSGINVLDGGPGDDTIVADEGQNTILVNRGGGFDEIISRFMNTQGQTGTFMIKDIFPGSDGCSLENPAQMNGILFFCADDGVYGPELWRSDGTESGTIMVKDIVEEGFPLYGEMWIVGGRPAGLTDVNGTLFFTARDRAHGLELWKSDGTEAGTVLVKDICPDSNSSDPQSLTNVNGTLFFIASDGDHGWELWTSDGTEAGTVMVKDIFPSDYSGVDYSNSNLTNANGTLFFMAQDDLHGWELWKSDGTEAGTVMIKDVNPSGSSMSWLSEVTSVNGIAFFDAFDGMHGRELWKSDGTEAGTVMVMDITPYYYGSSPDNLTNVNGVLFFTAYDDSHGTELWKSDGTAAGTVMVKDIRPGSQSNYLENLINVNGTLFFTASDGVNGYELWKSDGTETGTVMVKDIYPGSASSNLRDFTNAEGTLFFTATDGVNGRELWKSDGTEADTVMVMDICSGPDGAYPYDPIYVNGTLYFSADDGVHGRELWVSGEGFGSAESDTLTFGPGITPQDLNIAMTFSDTGAGCTMELTIGIGSAEGVVIRADSPGSGKFTPSDLAIQRFVFDDGTVLSLVDILARANGVAGYQEGADSDDTLQGSDSNDEIYALEGNDTIFAASGDDTVYAGSGEDTIFAGDGNDFIDAGDATDFIDAGPGDDTILGLQGGDTALGGSGDDTYHFNLGDGKVSIEDIAAPGEGNTIVFGDGIASGDISLAAGTDTLTLIIGSNGDEIGLKVFDPMDALGSHAVDTFTFADGSSLSYGELFQRGFDITGTEGEDLLQGTTVDDRILGLGGDDIFLAGPGSDLLDGGSGNDTYVFNTGDGVDTIRDGAATGAGNVVEFGIGITSGDLTLSTEEHTLVINVGSDGDAIRLEGFDPENPYDTIGVETFRFADGTILSAVDLLDLGFTFEGTPQDDTLTGTAARDTFIGRQGNDRILGGLGDDTYIFNSGDGVDTITDESTLMEPNMLIFGPGIAAEDISLSHDPANGLLVLNVAATGDTVQFTNFHRGDPYGTHAVEYFQFGDGSIRTYSQLIDRGFDIVGTAGDDTLTGTGTVDRIAGGDGNDTIGGGAGNDTLTGGAGDDTYLFNPGDGVDIIDDVSTVDEGNTLVFGEGITLDDIANRLSYQGDMLIVRVGTNGDEVHLTGFDREVADVGPHAVQTFEFADGTVLNYEELVRNTFIIQGDYGDDHVLGTNVTDRLYGYEGSDRLEGGLGNDTLTGGTQNDELLGGAGSDLYVFHLGDAVDTIDDPSTEGEENMILFDEGITPESIVTHMDGTTLVVEYGDQGDAIRLLEYDYNGQTGSRVVGTMEFSDGTRIQLASFVDPATEGDDTILGTYFEDTIDAKGGNDTVTTLQSNDTVYGGTGDDTIDAGPGDDLITGGPGSDTLIGGEGYDTYVFNLGDGVDTITDTSTQQEGNLIRFGDGITLDDITVSVDGTTLTIQYGDQGDAIQVLDFDYNQQTGSHVVETLGFSDGSYLRLPTLVDPATEGDDYILGSYFVDVINARGGHDTVIAYESDDTIDGGAGDDTIDAGAGYDTVIGGSGNDTLSGGPGNDTIDAGLGDDIITGGTGVDSLTGGQGNDTYVFNLGDGVDTIVDTALPGEGNTVQFGEGIVPDDLVLSYDGTTLIVDVGMYGDRLRLEGFDPQDALGPHAVGSFGFSDGTVLAYAELIARGFDLVGTEADDTITGTNVDDRVYGLEGNDTILTGAGEDMIDAGDGDDIITGGTGSDTLAGGAGNDTYVFNLGDGVDTIVDASLPGEGNTIQFGPGITSADLKLSYEGATLVIQVGTGGDRVRLEGFDPQDALGPHAVETFSFSDGTSITYEELIARGFDLMGTEGDDAILGTNVGDRVLGLGGNDTIETGSGSDLLDGGAGADTLIGGTGNDTYLVDDPADLVVENPDEGIDTVAASVTYTLADNVENLTLTGTDAIDGTGNDLDNAITGNSADNVLDGGAGSDTLSGGAGNDTYLVSDPGDVVIEQADEGIDTVRTGMSYTLAANVENLVLTGTEGIAGTGNDLDNTITGTSGANVLTGGAGSDALTGGAGSDLLDGGTGDDTMAGGEGDDTYVVDSTGDTVSEDPDEGMDTVQSSISYSLGGNLENLILVGLAAINGTGNGLDNLIIGNAAANTLTGGTGNDTVAGGLGNDTYAYNQGDGLDSVTDTGGQDAIVMGSGLDFDHTVIRLDATTAHLRFLDAQGNETGQGIDVSLDPDGTIPVETVTFASGAVAASDLVIHSEVTYGTRKKDRIRTGRNDDTIYALEGNDEVHAGSSNDTVYAGDGNDFVYGEDGRDTLYGEDGNDHLFGGNGDDTLDGGRGNDILQGGTGADTLFGGDGNDRIYGEDGSDRLFGGSGNDVLHGGDGSDELYGEDGNDTLYGSTGSDLLDGGSGNDTLSGADGNETLLGGAGNDTLSGGRGSDILQGGTGNDIIIGGEGDDTIVFNPGDGHDTVIPDVCGAISGWFGGGYNDGYDTVKFGASSLDLIFSESWLTLDVSIAGTSDTLTMPGGLLGGINEVDAFEASDGSRLAASQVDQLIQAMATFGAQNGMSWSQAIQQRPNDVQQILAQFWRPQ